MYDTIALVGLIVMVVVIAIAVIVLLYDWWRWLTGRPTISVLLISRPVWRWVLVGLVALASIGLAVHLEFLALNR